MVLPCFFKEVVAIICRNKLKADNYIINTNKQRFCISCAGANALTRCDPRSGQEHKKTYGKLIFIGLVQNAYQKA